MAGSARRDWVRMSGVGVHRRQNKGAQYDEFLSPFQRLSLYQSCMNHMVSKSDRKPQTKGALKK